MQDSTTLFLSGGQISSSAFSMTGARVGNATRLLAPSATLGSLDEGAWALMEGTQEALVASRLPCASELAFAADITRAIEVGRGL